VAGDPETSSGRMAPTALQLAPDPDSPGDIIANVVPLQICVRPRALSVADYDAITMLFAVAADPADVAQDEEPYVLYGAPPWIPQAAGLQPPGGSAAADYGSGADPDFGIELTAAGAGPAPPVMAGHSPQFWPADHPSGPMQILAGANDDTGDAVRPAAAARPPQVKILGPFTIAGAADQLQPKQAELVLALALAAPAGLSNSALCCMLGPDPDHPKPTDAVRQIITRTRRRLGTAADGQEYIIHAGNGHYLLHPDVALDWSAFRQLTASGRADDLRAAVALIGGQPFTGSYFWWIDIPLLETVRADLVDAAETLSEFELATGSPRAAARAARAGLLAEASAEQLWRAVMRAEHATGNLAGVTEAWRRCLDAIEDIAPGGEPHPDTETLYRQLTMAGRQRAPVL
jgi:DNA-binding SARP family transcriptional activator